MCLLITSTPRPSRRQPTSQNNPFLRNCSHQLIIIVLKSLKLVDCAHGIWNCRDNRFLEHVTSHPLGNSALLFKGSGYSPNVSVTKSPEEDPGLRHPIFDHWTSREKLYQALTIVWGLVTVTHAKCGRYSRCTSQLSRTSGRVEQKVGVATVLRLITYFAGTFCFVGSWTFFSCGDLETSVAICARCVGTGVASHGQLVTWCHCVRVLEAEILSMTLTLVLELCRRFDAAFGAKFVALFTW